MSNPRAVMRQSSWNRLSKSLVSPSQGSCSKLVSSRRAISSSSSVRRNTISSGLVKSSTAHGDAPRHPSAPPIARFHAADRSPRQFTPPTTDEEAVAHLKSVFQGLDFPLPVIRKIITHPSWKAGTEGHNNRLAFLGRRVLNSSLVLFLHEARMVANPAASSGNGFNPEGAEMSYQKMVDSVLDPYPLGGQVGRPWDIDRVTRWISALPKDAPDTAKSSGRNAARATTIEAIVGYIFHQYGATTAHRVFHTRILPHLKPLLEPTVQPYVDTVCERLGGPNGPLLEAAAASSSLHSSGAVFDAEPPRKRAGAAM